MATKISAGEIISVITGQIDNFDRKVETRAGATACPK